MHKQLAVLTFVHVLVNISFEFSFLYWTFCCGNPDFIPFLSELTLWACLSFCILLCSKVSQQISCSISQNHNHLPTNGLNITWSKSRVKSGFELTALWILQWKGLGFWANKYKLHCVSVTENEIIIVIWLYSWTSIIWTCCDWSKEKRIIESPNNQTNEYWWDSIELKIQLTIRTQLTAVHLQCVPVLTGITFAVWKENGAVSNALFNAKLIFWIVLLFT